MFAVLSSWILQVLKRNALGVLATFVYSLTFASHLGRCSCIPILLAEHKNCLLHLICRRAVPIQHIRNVHLASKPSNIIVHVADHASRQTKGKLHFSISSNSFCMAPNSFSISHFVSARLGADRAFLMMWWKYRFICMQLYVEEHATFFSANGQCFCVSNGSESMRK